MTFSERRDMQTMWKFTNFPVTQILREIDFGPSKTQLNLFQDFGYFDFVEHAQIQVSKDKARVFAILFARGCKNLGNLQYIDLQIKMNLKYET